MQCVFFLLLLQDISSLCGGGGTLKILRKIHATKLRLAFMFVPEYYRSGDALS